LIASQDAIPAILADPVQSVFWIFMKVTAQRFAIFFFSYVSAACAQTFDLTDFIPDAALTPTLRGTYTLTSSSGTTSSALRLENRATAEIVFGSETFRTIELQTH